MAKQISDSELERRYDDFLDEVYGKVKIAGLEYATSEAVKEIDHIAYREGYNNWLDSELGVTIWEKDGEYYDSDPDSEDD